MDVLQTMAIDLERKLGGECFFSYKAETKKTEGKQLTAVTGSMPAATFTVLAALAKANPRIVLHTKKDYSGGCVTNLGQDSSDINSPGVAIDFNGYSGGIANGNLENFSTQLSGN
ncbi:hypothetical protein LTR10_014977 [Elasticomyces elasticus]|nr:hypothetical protein LTR10_014977 [Elasticomyces elasticus]